MTWYRQTLVTLTLTCILVQYSPGAATSSTTYLFSFLCAARKNKMTCYQAHMVIVSQGMADVL